MALVVWYRVISDDKLGLTQVIPVIVDEQVAPALGPTSPNRRVAVRYPLALPGRYRVLGRRFNIAVKTIDWSRNGIRFSTDRELKPGTRIELTVDWPAVRDDGTGVQLVIRGIVVRSAAAEASIQIYREEFQLLDRAYR